MTKARIYLVSTPNESPRLVRAISQSQAVKHVTRPYVATTATAEDVARWPGQGAKVENAGTDEGEQS